MAKVITQTEVKRLFRYDPKTGLLTRRIDVGKKSKKGDTVGSTDGQGYIQTQINGKHYMLHRLIYLYMTGNLPKNQIDHINHNRSDNRWCNLRVVSHRGNGINQTRSKRNTSGIVGVSWNKLECKWKTFISDKSELIYLGSYTSLFEAACVRKAAEIKYGYHENHGAVL